MQSPVFRAVEVPKHNLDSYHMFIAGVVNVPAKNSDSICDIGSSGSHCIHGAFNNHLVCGRITGIFVRLSLVKLYRYWRGNWSGLIHSELRQDRPNVAVLMDVDRVNLPISFYVHAEIERDSSEIMHPEPLLHHIHDTPNQTPVSNDKEIRGVLNDRSNYVLILIMQQGQSSVDM